MKKSTKALTFAAVAMATGMAVSGCWNGFGGNVYGPPPSDNTRPATSKIEETETKETTVPTKYDPAAEPEVDVYGPPPEDNYD